mgnify:CR=1 FL=1
MRAGPGGAACAGQSRGAGVQPVRFMARRAQKRMVLHPAFALCWREAPRWRCVLLMIRAVDCEPAGAGSDLVRQVERMFSPEGVLSRAKNFEYRPQQQAMAVAVAREGKIIWEEAFGWADRENRVPAFTVGVCTGRKLFYPVAFVYLLELYAHSLMDYIHFIFHRVLHGIGIMSDPSELSGN